VTQPILTPIAEVCDRYTIAQLKAQRLPAEENTDQFNEQVDYYSAGIDWENRKLSDLVEKLYECNAAVWDAEYAIRKCQDEELGLKEIGRRALRIRDLNKQRIAVKNEICKLVKQDTFTDCKMNSSTYASDS
jgi:hypothetical protein